MSQEERTLRGIMADRHITQDMLAAELKLARSTVNRKIQLGTFTLKEAAKMIRYFRIVDPLLAYDIFLRESSQ